MAVERCICHQITFEEIRKKVEELNLSTIEELQDRGICSTNCRLCIPYIHTMLKTGETSFEPGAVYDHKI